ncbi:MAG TPA: peptide chain release factor N(5)-glutamine methyltransferase [Gallionellaceae bacterium]
MADAAKLAAALLLDSSSARLEVQYLLQHVLGKPRAWLLAHAETILNPEQLADYGARLQQRLRGEPIAYILGEREFYGLKFKVTPATLIPRPETELLVEQALQRIPQERPCQVLDLGAGSGAIALSIAHERPKSGVVAVDASLAALEVAQENAARLGIRNANFLHGDWYASLGGRRFDLIVSNPPYVAKNDPHLQQGDLRFEPASALASGTDGLDDIRRIVDGAGSHLEPGGWLLLEHGYDQAVRVRELLERAGFAEVFSVRDLGDIERVSGGRRAI